MTSAVSVLVAVAPATSAWAQSDRRDPFTIARERLEAARDQVVAVTDQLAALDAERVRLEGEIAAAERAIPELRARAEWLRGVVKQRAAILYVGRDRRLEAFLQARNAVEGARAAALTSIVAAADLDLATALADTARQLEIREGELKARRGELQATMAALQPLEVELQRRLELATGVYDKVRRSVGRTAAGRGANLFTGATRCPVDGFTIVNNDYGQPRPDDRLHEGVDLFALAGMPLVAVVDGYVRHDVSELGGTGVWLDGDDQVSYYYAHLSRWEGGERPVRAGDVVGYVGATGDATGPHLHFEVHPGGGAPVNPYALLTVLCAEETVRPRG